MGARYVIRYALTEDVDQARQHHCEAQRNGRAKRNTNVGLPLGVNKTMHLAVARQAFPKHKCSYEQDRSTGEKASHQSPQEAQVEWRVTTGGRSCAPITRRRDGNRPWQCRLASFAPREAPVEHR